MHEEPQIEVVRADDAPAATLAASNAGSGDFKPILHRYLSFATVVPRPLDEAPACPSLSPFAAPLEWARAYKIFVACLCYLSTLVTTYTPGAYTAGLTQYRAEWGVSTTAVYAGLTTFTLCFAVAPMLLAPVSEAHGRRPVFLTAGAVYVVSQLGSGVTASFAGLVVTRALAGASCSVFSTIVGGVVSDIYVASERNTAMAIFSGAALCGTGIGPLVSGVIAQHYSWRWIFYLQTISCAVVVAALFFFFPETRGSVLLARKASVLNKWMESVEQAGFYSLEVANLSQETLAAVEEGKEGGEEGQTEEGQEEAKTPRQLLYRLRYKVKADEERANLAVLIRTSLLRPLRLLVTESVVFWFSLWMAFAWSILYLTFEALPLMFTSAYGFSTQANGFVFASVSIASIIATVVAIWQNKLLLNGSPTSRLARLVPNGQPEARLFFACGQSLLLPIGLFWLGATARPAVPWIVPVLACGCITLGIYSVYLAVFNYLADTYHAYASSAIAAQSFTRNVFAACLPLATESMFNALGFVGVGCLLGGVGLVLSAVPWVLVRWGPQIRSRSRIACTLN